MKKVLVTLTVIALLLGCNTITDESYQHVVADTSIEKTLTYESMPIPYIDIDTLPIYERYWHNDNVNYAMDYLILTELRKTNELLEILLFETTGVEHK